MADCVRPQRFTTPSSFFENPYVPAILIGLTGARNLATSFAMKRPEPLATASTVKFCTSGLSRCFVFVHL